MKDDPNDTLTTIEAKVLCLRYGIKNVDDSSSVNKLREQQSPQDTAEHSLQDVAEQLGEEKSTLQVKEINALRKLNIPV